MVSSYYLIIFVFHSQLYILKVHRWCNN